MRRIKQRITSCLLALLTLPASAVTLAWDPSPDSNIVAYILYWGYASGNYSFSTNVNTNLTAVVTDLARGTNYFFVVTAMNEPGLESDPSNEVSYRVPWVLPPRNLTITVESSTNLVSWAVGDTFTVPAPPGFYRARLAIEEAPAAPRLTLRTADPAPAPKKKQKRKLPPLPRSPLDSIPLPPKQ